MVRDVRLRVPELGWETISNLRLKVSDLAMAHIQYGPNMPQHRRSQAGVTAILLQLVKKAVQQMQ